MEGSIYHFDHFGRVEMFGPAEARGPARALRTASANPRVGLIRNPRSHRNQGQDQAIRGHADLLVAEPRDRAELPAILAQFARDGIDLLVIDGGDGTVRDVLTCAYPAFGNRWPRIAVLPQGKTNALNVDLGAPAGWTVEGAIDAYRRGRIVKRRPLLVSPASGSGVQVLGFILGAGAFTTGIRAGQDAHRYGAFNSLAVGVTAAWGIVQALFGSDSNVWRRGVGMRLWTGDRGEELPHSGHGDPRRREILLASTLSRMPLGMKLFSEREENAIGLTVMDKPRRRLVAMIPAILMGYQPRWLARTGLHFTVTDRFAIDLDEPFIFDGETFPAGSYRVERGPQLQFVVP